MRHHVVPKSYLRQWLNSRNQLHIYSILEQKYYEKGPDWHKFWKEDYNILHDPTYRYLPETVTQQVDTAGIKAIRAIDTKQMTQLGDMDRSGLAFFLALQYIRTPRHRDEENKLIEATIKKFHKEDVSSPEKVSLTREDILKTTPTNDIEREAVALVSKMSDEEFQKKLYDVIQGGEYKIRLTKEGHSKAILKVARESKIIHGFQWCFLVAPPGTEFITSDNPCFVTSPNKFMNGIASPTARTIFPLRPDVCVYVNQSISSTREEFMMLDADGVHSINKMIVTHSYHLVVARNLPQLEKLMGEYDISSHKTSRDVAIYQMGDYTMFNME